jgi:hypothetical protein
MECVEQLGHMFKVHISHLSWEVRPNCFLIWNDVFAQPEMKEIKKRIEDLISRDHMEREKDNANLFKYLAWCDLDDKLLLQLLQIANQMMIQNYRKSVPLDFLKGRGYPFKVDIYFSFFYHTSTALLYIKSKNAWGSPIFTCAILFFVTYV